MEYITAYHGRKLDRQDLGPEEKTKCDSGTSLCPGNGLAGVNKPQKKGSPKTNQSPVPKIRVSHTPENNNQKGNKPK